MTTIDRKTTAPHPPVAYREEQPVSLPPKPPPPTSRAQFLWWLAALAGVVVVLTAVALLVEDDGGRAYVNTETQGRPGAVLEAWDLTTPSLQPVDASAGSSSRAHEAAAADVALLNVAGLVPVGVSLVSDPAVADVAMLNTAGWWSSVRSEGFPDVARIRDIEDGFDRAMLVRAASSPSTDRVIVEIWDGAYVMLPRVAAWVPPADAAIRQISDPDVALLNSAAGIP